MSVYKLEDIINKIKQKPLLEVAVYNPTDDPTVRIDITNETQRERYKHNYRIKAVKGNSRYGTSVGFFEDYDIPFDALSIRSVSHIEYNSDTDKYLDAIIATSVILRTTILKFIHDKNLKLINGKNISEYQTNLAASLNIIFYENNKYGYKNRNNLKVAADAEWMLRNPGKNIKVESNKFIKSLKDED